MMLQTFFLLVISHFIADFFLQGRLAIKKRGFNKYMLAHGAIMTLAFLVPLVNYPPERILPVAGILFMAHIALDAIRFEINRLLEVKPLTYYFNVSLGIDQILHITILYVLFTKLIL